VDRTQFGVARCASRAFFVGWLCIAAPTLAAPVSILHRFTGSPSDGNEPFAGPTLNGTNLYGTTVGGGSASLGAIYSMSTSGSGAQLLHSFAGGTSDGRGPESTLATNGATLYGTTFLGGASDKGTVFSLNTDGTSFQLLHSFASSDSDGQLPQFASLTLAGSRLFGTTPYGGANLAGTVFALNTDGSNYQVLHSFSAAGSAGYGPAGGVVVSGSILFGTTEHSDFGLDTGTLYAMNADGTGYHVLHTFLGGANDGAGPTADLTLVGSTILGTTWAGGLNNAGTVFSINTDGTGYQLLHAFSGGANGSHPQFGVTAAGSVLYGSTRASANGKGTVYELNMDGTGFQVLQTFPSPSDPVVPVGKLALSVIQLFGASAFGGNQLSGNGTLFAITVPEPSTWTLVGAALACALASAGWHSRWRLRLVAHRVEPR
jgi:uncharacterized repeat protein (TIGR03803 family)